MLWLKNNLINTELRVNNISGHCGGGHLSGRCSTTLQAMVRQI